MAAAAKKKAAPKASPGQKRMTKQIGAKAKEALANATVSDQAKARAAVASLREAMSAVTKPATKAKASKAADTRKLTLVAKECPSAPGTKRAERWSKLKPGMTVSEAGAVGVPRTYLERMAKAGHLKLG